MFNLIMERSWLRFIYVPVPNLYHRMFLLPEVKIAISICSSVCSNGNMWSMKWYATKYNLVNTIWIEYTRICYNILQGLQHRWLWHFCSICSLFFLHLFRASFFYMIPIEQFCPNVSSLLRKLVHDFNTYSPLGHWKDLRNSGTFSFKYRHLKSIPITACKYFITVINTSSSANVHIDKILGI